MPGRILPAGPAGSERHVAGDLDSPRRRQREGGEEAPQEKTPQKEAPQTQESRKEASRQPEPGRCGMTRRNHIVVLLVSLAATLLAPAAAQAAFGFEPGSFKTTYEPSSGITGVPLASS